MSRTAQDGDVVRDLLSVADLLEEPQLARLYAYVNREGPATVKEAMDALDLPQGTYSHVNRLQEAGVLAAVSDD